MRRPSEISRSDCAVVGLPYWVMVATGQRITLKEGKHDTYRRRLGCAALYCGFGTGAAAWHRWHTPDQGPEDLDLGWKRRRTRAAGACGRVALEWAPCRDGQRLPPGAGFVRRRCLGPAWRDCRCVVGRRVRLPRQPPVWRARRGGDDPQHE